MINIEQVFSSSDHYRQAFEKGLVDIIHHQTAGTFILGCANTFQHAELLEKNIGLLQSTYDNIARQYQLCKEQNIEPDDSADDAAVINRLIEIGFENLNPVQSKTISLGSISFTVNYNQLRSFRPSRMSGAKKLDINTAFNEDGFHFDKEFLIKETFAEGSFHGRQLSLLYNKFPFVDYHALLVLDKHLHHNQCLTENHLDFIAMFMAQIQTQIPELVIAYNSLGAGASVNHLHFQLYLEKAPLSIFSSEINLNGGTKPYPIPCIIFNEQKDCWSHIKELHSSNAQYNLIFKGNKIYCFHRQATVIEFNNIDVSMYGWAEMAGIFTVTDKELFDVIDPHLLLNTLKSVTTKHS